MITFTLIALKMALWSATRLSVAFVQMQVHQQSVVSYSHITYAHICTLRTPSDGYSVLVRWFLVLPWDLFQEGTENKSHNRKKNNSERFAKSIVLYVSTF